LTSASSSLDVLEVHLAIRDSSRGLYHS
jgi:hypothetical protein